MAATGTNDDQHRELTNEEDFQQVDTASVVNIISTPWHVTNPTAGRKAAATKVLYDNPQAGIYTFNPNTGLRAAAAAVGMDEAEQGRRWLQLWTQVLAKVKNTCGTCYVMARGRNEDDFVLEGGAQHGEVEVAKVAGVPIKYIFYTLTSVATSSTTTGDSAVSAGLPPPKKPRLPSASTERMFAATEGSAGSSQPAQPTVPVPAAAEEGVGINSMSHPMAGKLLVAGCANGLAAVGRELDAISAEVPGSRLLRDVSADRALEACATGHTSFHFAGHSDAALGTARTLVWHKTGRPEAVDAQTLVGMLRGFELVVLNGCKSLALAVALANAGVPNVVGCETLIADEPGRLFAQGFWRSMASESRQGDGLREAVRRAFDHGLLAVRAATAAGGSLTTHTGGSVAASTPLYALGIDPEDASLVGQTGAERGRCLPAAGADAVGRKAAGRWVLLQPLPSSRLHGSPPVVPEHFEPRAEQEVVLDALVGAHLPIALVGGGRGTTSLAGTAGLGKTTLAAWLVRDLQVQSAFHDGIFWLKFGQECGASEVLLRLARMLDVEQRSTDETVDKIKPLLEGKRCLLVLDDVWTYAQVSPFRGLGAAGLLLTTRLREVANRAGALREMAPLAPEQALRMLATCMETGDDLSTSEDARQLVRLSGGLPVVLESWGVACRSQSIGSLLQELRQARHEVEVLEVEGGGDYDYVTFFAGLEVQLARLDQSDARLAACYSKLAVLREDSKMELDGAAQMWGESEFKAKQIAKKLAGMHLLKLTEEEGAVASLELLDVHLQYLRHRGRNSLEGWHVALLDGCPAKVPAESGYWKDRFNFAHHLVRAGGRMTCPRLQQLECAA